MTDERESLAKAKRAAIVAQRAMEVLGGAEPAYVWLTTPCELLGGTAPCDMTYDAIGARRALQALRRVQ